MLLTEKKNKAEVLFNTATIEYYYFHVPWYSTFYSLLEKTHGFSFFFSVSWPVQKVVHNAVSKTILELLIAPHR